MDRAATAFAIVSLSAYVFLATLALVNYLH